MKKLIIIGVGGFGREVAWLVERINKVKPTWDLLGFVDDNEELHGTTVGGYKVLGNCDYLINTDIYAICAIGSSRIRKKIIEKLVGIKFAVLIDPSTIVSKNVTIGEGTIICAGTIMTIDIEIGCHVIINLDCTIGHDSVLNDFVTLYPSVNVSGNTILEECVEIGTGTQIIQRIRVGYSTIIGAGSVVIRDIPANCTAVGTPSKIIKSI